MSVVLASAPTPAGRLARRELAPLVDELFRRFGEGDVPVVVTLRGLAGDERSSVADLFGLDRLPGPVVRVRVDRLVERLGLASLDDLRSAVEALRWPVPDRRAQRVADRSARDELAWLADEAAAVVPRLGPAAAAAAAWVERIRAQGARGGVDVHRRRLERALGVLRALPADGVPLAAFAGDVAGDPHALDRGRRLAAMVWRWPATPSRPAGCGSRSAWRPTRSRPPCWRSVWRATRPRRWAPGWRRPVPPASPSSSRSPSSAAGRAPRWRRARSPTWWRTRRWSPTRPVWAGPAHRSYAARRGPPSAW